MAEVRHLAGDPAQGKGRFESLAREAIEQGDGDHRHECRLADDWRGVVGHVAFQQADAVGAAQASRARAGVPGNGDDCSQQSGPWPPAPPNETISLRHGRQTRGSRSAFKRNVPCPERRGTPGPDRHSWRHRGPCLRRAAYRPHSPCPLPDSRRRRSPIPGCPRRQR